MNVEKKIQSLKLVFENIKKLIKFILEECCFFFYSTINLYSTSINTLLEKNSIVFIEKQKHLWFIFHLF